MSFVLLICSNPARDVILDDDWQLRASCTRFLFFFSLLFLQKENPKKSSPIWSHFSWQDEGMKGARGEEEADVWVSTRKWIVLQRLYGVWEWQRVQRAKEAHRKQNKASVKVSRGGQGGWGSARGEVDVKTENRWWCSGLPDLYTLQTL